MAGIGVFICHCGINIARTVDVEKVVEDISKEPDVVLAKDYTYVCSTPGQQMVVDCIREQKLDRLVISACSPKMHEVTFRRAAAKAGLNPYLCEIANIREQCSWVHEDKEVATAKAIEIIRATLAKIRKDIALEAGHIKVTKKALVIGGGIAGIQAALDISAGGIEVIMVEREPCIGGHMAQLSETFPTLDCASCIYTPKVVEVDQNERIKLYAYSEIEEVKGMVGKFEVKLRRKARYVNESKCTGCGLCIEKCPRKNIPSEFDHGVGTRKAVYIPFAQAVPRVATIDKENCIYFRTGKCKLCEKACEPGAIDHEQKDEFISEEVGAIVVAAGYQLLSRDVYGEYGYGKYKDMIDGFQLERMLSASGPHKGMVKRPSDGKVPQEIVFIACVGSRDDSKNISYCSKICCMYTAKHTMLYKHRVPDGKAYVFYMDIRAGGKKYEEFVKRAIAEEGAIYLRGRVSSVREEDGKLTVQGDDTLSGEQIEIAADMVVLACAIRPQPDIDKLARLLRIGTDQDGFVTESHVKLRPVETSTTGIFVAGVCQGPKDIPDTVAQAGCAAAKVLALFSSDELMADPMVAAVDEEICSGCGVCIDVCSYEARVMDEKKGIATVEEVLCQGCGACTAACPSGATNLKNFKKEQILDMVDAVV